jgi:cytidyltransferase-like protein
MAERTAVFPGCFDPPHSGHIDTLQLILQTGKVDHVVVVSVRNPTKTRLLTTQNSAAMLKRMLPPDIAGRVTICDSDKSVPRLAKQFNAVSVVRGRRRTEKPVKNLVQEAAIAAYLGVNRLSHLRKPLHLIWLKKSAESGDLSSTKVRNILFGEDCSQEKLEKLMPADTASILLRAKAECPDVSKENTQDFNRALACLLGVETPKPAARQKRPAIFSFGRK